jgi:hypothetical protein
MEAMQEAATAPQSIIPALNRSLGIVPGAAMGNWIKNFL